jgi:nucleotide-binding universal stress UspA family protein
MKTTEIKKVLIALDYNPTAQKVAEEGFLIAKSMKAEVTLLHVISDPINYTSTGHVLIMGFTGKMDIPPIEKDGLDALKKASRDFLDQSKIHLGDDSIQTMVKEGDCAEAILKAAKEIHADTIVIGTHSRKWLENVLMGSVAENVLRQTTIPLYIIPTKKHK